MVGQVGGSIIALLQDFLAKQQAERGEKKLSDDREESIAKIDSYNKIKNELEFRKKYQDLPFSEHVLALPTEDQKYAARKEALGKMIQNNSDYEYSQNDLVRPEFAQQAEDESKEYHVNRDNELKRIYNLNKPSPFGNK